MSRPAVTILVLNYNGEHHLRECLPSLDALVDVDARVTVIDNGSQDGSLRYLERQHPHVHVLRMNGNLGFARPYNEAVRQADTELVALLNNDTRVDRRWLAEMLATMQRQDAAAVSSAILDWNGSSVDFAGPLPTFLGHSWQMDHGEPVGRAYPERQVLFASGGSMLIRRGVFLAHGGFDDDFFAYFEDVDLGWRLTLMGHRTFFAPAAITYHRRHATASAWAQAVRLRLYERNALACLYKNYDDDALRRVLPAAVALTLARALQDSGLDPASVAFGVRARDVVALRASVVSSLIGLEDLSRWLPALEAKRQLIQSRRRVADAEVFRLFPEPLRLHDLSPEYRAAAETLIHDFRIGDLFGRPTTRAVAVAAPIPQADAAPVDEPLVSIVVLTASGARHLPECLQSLRAHAWPADRTEVIVVDNGSPEDPTSVAEQHYPGVRVVRTHRNLGFAVGNNAGARAARGSWLVFLNDDTRVDAQWLTRMMGVARRRSASCVGAFLVDWTGNRVDFAGGTINLEARGFALHHGDPVSTVSREESATLFPCGAAVMFRRDIFDATGGWDEHTFAYYEDVEFGWRLWLLGHEVWMAPDAVVYHKHHGTSGAESPARRRALERNAMRMLYTHLSHDALARVLPAALMLAANRVLLDTPYSRAHDGSGSVPGSTRRRLPLRSIKVRLLHALSRRGARRHAGLLTNLRQVGVRGLAAASREALQDVRFGRQPRNQRDQFLIERAGFGAAPEGHNEDIPIGIAAALLGLNDFIVMLPELSTRREWLQARRQRSDEDIIERFGRHWWNAVPAARQDLHEELREQVLAAFIRAGDSIPAGTMPRD